VFEILEKIILAGAGLVSLTKEKAEAIVDAMIAKGQVKAKDRIAVLGKILRSTKRFDKEFDKKMKKVSSEITKEYEKQIAILKGKMAKLAKDLHLKKKRGTIKSKQKKTDLL